MAATNASARDRWDDDDRGDRWRHERRYERDDDRWGGHHFDHDRGRRSNHDYGYHRHRPRYSHPQWFDRGRHDHYHEHRW